MTVIGGNVDDIKVGKKFVPLTSSGHLAESTTYTNEDGEEKPVRYFAIIKIVP